MNDHMQGVNMSALEAAVKSLMGDRGAEILRELYFVIDAAETRGATRSDVAAYQRGYEAGYDEACWGPQDARVPESDLREPIINAVVEGEFVDRSEPQAENRSPQPVTDEEFYAAVEQHFGA